MGIIPAGNRYIAQGSPGVGSKHIRISDKCSVEVIYDNAGKITGIKCEGKEHEFGENVIKQYYDYDPGKKILKITEKIIKSRKPLGELVYKNERPDKARMEIELVFFIGFLKEAAEIAKTKPPLIERLFGRALKIAETDKKNIKIEYRYQAEKK